MKIQMRNLRRDELCESLTNQAEMKLGTRGTRPSGGKLNRAFTLVEMLLVVTIIGILAALVIPRIVGVSERSRVTAAQTDIQGGIKSALGAYEVDVGSYPKNLQDLIQQPSNARNWHGPYLEKMPLDPWGSPYVYYYPGKHSAAGYDLLSIGPDQKEGTDDDIGNWMN